MGSISLYFIVLITFKICFAKVYELYNRDHFHDQLQDLPVGLRYASVVAFYNDTPPCQSSLAALPFDDTGLPSVEHIFLGKYEFSTEQKRTWYKWRDQLDLGKYLGVKDYMNSKEECECPILAFIPSTYADELTDDYTLNPSINDVKIWNSEEEPNWKIWAWKNIKQTVKLVIDIPFDYEVTINHQTINSYLSQQGKSWTDTYKVDSYQSHFDLETYPGDTIYISKDPELPPQLKKIRKTAADKMPKPTSSSMNPTYMVHAGMKLVNVIQFDDETWGFDDKRPSDLSASFIARRHSTTLMTHTRNLVLPKILPATHSKGFVKIPMPDGLHDRLKKFYSKWYHLKAQEGWDKSGTQLNFYKVKTHMISLDHDFHERDSIAKGVVKPLLLNWAHSNGWTNISDIEFTAFYGIREYSRGASLRNHVDRVDTHVFSAILQVAQTNIDSDWPLQVIGFDGIHYDINLKPGEMILYEGHKLVHGRPYPFNGTIFSNAFCHFKPVGWKWTTSQVWKDPVARATLKDMHMDMRSIYR